MVARIYKPPKKKRDYKADLRNENKQFSTNLYQTSFWHKTRKAILMEHPLCVDCEKEGKIKFAEEVHHIKPFLLGKTEQERLDLFYDTDNLVPLCK